MTTVVLVTAPACHFCEEARAALDELSLDFPLDVRELDAAAPEAGAVIERWRPPMWPLVLVDGVFFSAGRLPRKKLQRRLERTVRAA